MNKGLHSDYQSSGRNELKTLQACIRDLPQSYGDGTEMLWRCKNNTTKIDQGTTREFIFCTDFAILVTVLLQNRAL